ncbi:MAG: YigZ family protein [Bacillota bacterium]|nr:YigZ family protein [Bacillota bacterium]
MKFSKYKTVLQFSEQELIEKHSRFISSSAPVHTQDEALSFLSNVKHKYPDAKHHVYAYCLFKDGRKRFSDDGEPSGTAGKPVLDVIEKNEIYDVIVVVTRYFGGVLLGTGGLVHAYSHSAKLAVEASKIVTMRLCSVAEIACDYGQYQGFERILKENRAVIDAVDFTENVKILFHLALNELENVNRQLMESSGGKVQAIAQREEFLPF